MNHKKMRRIALFGAIAIVGVVLFVHFFSKQPVTANTTTAGSGGGRFRLNLSGLGGGRRRGHAGHITSGGSQGDNAASEPDNTDLFMGNVPRTGYSPLIPVNVSPPLQQGGAIPSASY